MKIYSPNVLFLSSVLQYLEDPHKFVKTIIDSNEFDYILIDRLPVFEINSPDLLTVQCVPKHIYSASSPCWFFNKDGMLSHFNDKYTLIQSFSSVDGDFLVGGRYGSSRGFFFAK